MAEREKAAIRVLITLEPPTPDTKCEAVSAAHYDSPGCRRKYPRLQIRTIEDLLAGTGIDYPPSMQTNVTFKKPATRAPRAAQGAPGRVSADD